MNTNILRPLREDLTGLWEFLFFREPTASRSKWRSRCRPGSSRGEYARLAARMLREVRGLPCDCRRLPHRENCARVRALAWEHLFFTRWGITVDTRGEGAPLPAEILALGGHDETPGGDGSVLLFPVGRAS